MISCCKLNKRMDLKLTLFLICSFHQVESNDCSLCTCERGLNLVYCFGYEITKWPRISNDSWVYDLSFIKTRISYLPDLGDDFRNLNNLDIEECPYLVCSELRKFQKRHPHITIITDINCYGTTNEK